MQDNTKTAIEQGFYMLLWDALDKAKAASGLSDRAISKSLCRSNGYFSALKARKGDLQISTVVRIFEACGYGLFAVPIEDETGDAIRIVNKID